VGSSLEIGVLSDATLVGFSESKLLLVSSIIDDLGLVLLVCVVVMSKVLEPKPKILSWVDPCFEDTAILDSVVSSILELLYFILEATDIEEAKD
jgi:hypothetical protein